MLALIPAWLLDGSGDGYGDGFGFGDGDGYGSGYGDGSGYGYGFGYGSGYGDGDGFGDGSGYGSGYGFGSGSGKRVVATWPETTSALVEAVQTEAALVASLLHPRVAERFSAYPDRETVHQALELSRLLLA